MKATNNSTKIDHQPFENEQLDAFDKDAFSGWKQHDFNMQLMQPLNRRFAPKFFGIIPFIILSIFCIVTVLISNYKSTASVQPPQATPIKQLYTEKEYYELAEIIVLPIQKQISPKHIARTFQLKKEVEVKNTAQSIQDDNLATLPIQNKHKIEPTKELTFATKQAKEIYLEGYKLIDYRAYRSRPIEKMKAAPILTGTTADKENAFESEKIESANNISIPYIDYIQLTLKAFKKEKFEKTIQLTGQILNHYPDDINALFYQGLSYYNVGNIEKARSNFEKLKSAEYQNFKEESEWFLTHCYLAQKEYTAADISLQTIIEGKGFYQLEAEKLRAKLQSTHR